MVTEMVSSSSLGEDRWCTDPGRSIFLASASYEDRSLVVASSLPKGCRFAAGLVYVNEEFLSGGAAEATKRNMERLSSLLEQRCGVVRTEIGSWLDPARQLQALRRLVNVARERCSEAPNPCIYIDSSTFTRESLVVSCALLRRERKPTVLRLFYTAAAVHGTWLSRGFRCVRNIVGYAGVQVPGAPTVLIVMSGFEPERTTRVIDEHEPSRVLLGIGNPPTNSAFLDRNRKEQELVLARQDVEQFEFPARSVAECVTCLESLVVPNLRKANVIIAPMSTKLSTVAAMLVADRHPEVQLTYCVPGEYNTETYSEGVRAIFVEDI